MKAENGYIVFKGTEYQYSDIYGVLAEMLPELEGFDDRGEYEAVLVCGRWVPFSDFIDDLDFDCKLEAIERLEVRERFVIAA